MSHIARSSLLIAFFFGMSKITGFFRQIMIARQFGLSYEIDVFNAANNIPDLLSALISGGALGVALIPVLSEYLEKRNRQAAWHLFSRILNLAFIVTGLLALLVAGLAEPLVKWVIVPGFPPDQQALTAELMRLDLIAIMIFSISGLVMSGLQANQHFFFPAMAPVFYDIGQITGLVVFSPSEGYQIGAITLPALGLGIHGLVFGVILGALFHLLIQVPGLVKYKFEWQFGLGLKDPAIHKVLTLLGPRIATMFFIQVYFVARDNLASSMGEGSVTALNYGWFLMQVPETMIGTAIAIAILPTLSELMARGDLDSFRETLNRGIKVMLSLTIPTAALLAVAMEPLVFVLGFDEAGSRMVVLATRAYLLGLTGHALLEIAARSFYARQDARTPFFAAALTSIGFIILAITFSRQWDHTGIALANSAAFTAEALALFWLLNRKVPGLLKLDGALVRIVIGTGLGAGAVYGTLALLPLESWPDLYQVAAGLGALAIGGLVALPFLWRELKQVIRL